jgi:hypothetical protein
MNQPPVQINQPYHETVYRFDPVALKAWLDNRASQGGIQKQRSESAGPKNRKGEGQFIDRVLALLKLSRQ